MIPVALFTSLGRP